MGIAFFRNGKCEMHCPKCGKDDRETFDVKDRLIIFTYDSHWTSDMIDHLLKSLKPVSTNLTEQGAIAVIALSSDLTVSSLDERALTELGLRKI